MNSITINSPVLLRITPLLVLIIFLASCEKKETDEEDQEEKVQHESVLKNNSGWSSLAFDSKVFYPYGGFSGFDIIKLAQPFVHDGQPKAVAEYIKNSSTGSFVDIMAVVNGEVVRQPLSGSGELVIGEKHLYRYLENDENKNYVRRLNGPDYSTYNSFDWEVDKIEQEVIRLGHTVGNYISSGTPDFIHLNDTINAMQANYLNIRENGTGSAQQRVVMTRIEMPRNVGYVREVVVLPYQQDLGENFYLELRSKYLDGKIMTIGYGSRNAYMLFGSFKDGFSYVKTVENVRGITAFYKGKENFFCVLKESGGSRNLAYKIDLNGNVTDLGIIESAYDDAFSHYRGDLVVARIENTDSSGTVVEKITASGREVLGSPSLTKSGSISVLMSDGDQLFGAAVNEISPLYQGGGRQFLGWEFVKYD